MSPLLTHRRSRRRSRARRLVVLVCALVVAAVLIGGVARIGSRSGPFRASVNRSFGAQGDGARRPVQCHRRLPAPADGGDAGSGSPDSPGRAGRRHGAGRRPGGPGRRPGEQRRRRRPVRHCVRGSGPVRRRGAVGHRRPARPAPPARGRRPGRPRRRRGHSDVVVVHRRSRIASPPPAASSPRPIGATRRCALPGRHGGARPASRIPVDQHARARGRSAPWRRRSIWSPPRRPWPPPLSSASAWSRSPRPRSRPRPAWSPPGVSVLSPTKTVVLNVSSPTTARSTSPMRPSPSRWPGCRPAPTATARRAASVLAARSVSLAPVTFAVKPGNSYQLTVAIAVPAGQAVAAGTTFVEGLQISPST